MGFMTWFRQLGRGRNQEPMAMPAYAGETRFFADMIDTDAELLGEPQDDGELDFATAVRSHQMWKGRLLAAVEGRGQAPQSPNAACVGEHCALGRWIHGTGTLRHAESDIFQSLCGLHADFHRAAAEVLRAAEEGRNEAARRLMAGRYKRLSVQLQGKLAELFLTAAEPATPDVAAV